MQNKSNKHIVLCTTKVEEIIKKCVWVSYGRVVALVYSELKKQRVIELLF